MITGSQSWLQNLGFMDFAGASVVHMTAGFIALAGLTVVGPRAKTNTGKSNIPLAVLGVFILWFGWFGFNGACISPEDPGLAKVFVNTTMAAGCGTLGALMLNFFLHRKGGYLLSLFNGVLGGLVAVTAVSAYCSPPAAMLLGLIAGVLSDLVSSLLIKAAIDDIVNVVPVHLIGGITGCVLLPFMIDSSYIQAGGRLEQFGVQLTGVAVNCLWAFGIAYLLFRVLDRIMGLRVTAEEKNKLARDLHDGVGQSLSALKMILGMGQKQAEKSGASGLAQTAEKASALADLSIKEMRNVLNNLKPQILQRDGLQAGLAEMT